MPALAAVTGIGEVPTGRYPERDALQAAVEVSRQAILDSGVPKAEIDVIVPSGALFSREFTTALAVGRLVEELGLLGTASGNLQLFAGGSSSAMMMQVATGFIKAGMARNVLCVHSDSLGTGIDKSAGVDLFATAGLSPEWEIPFGLNFSAVAGLITRRFMEETGATEEHLANVCVSMRRWAELNPNAMYRSPLSVDDVLASKMLATPIHALESNMLADGAAAFVVSGADAAPDLTDTPVYLLGSAGRMSHHHLASEQDMAHFTYREAAAEAFGMAGITPADVQIAEIYDSYPVFALIALEEIGLVGKGESGAFVAAGETSPGGKLPMTTNGGMLSQGHTGAGGGVAIFVEAVRQLMGKAGDRQVDCTFAVETATAHTYIDAHVSILGKEVP